MIAIRGAICATNTGESISVRTAILLERIFEANQLDVNNIISVMFTCTKDLNAAYPAVAARGFGLTQASLMCAQEMDVLGSMQGIVRVQVLAVNSGLGQAYVKHVYLGRAAALRPDLS